MLPPLATQLSINDACTAAGYSSANDAEDVASSGASTMLEEAVDPPQLAKRASEPTRAIRPRYFLIEEVWQVAITPRAWVLIP